MRRAFEAKPLQARGHRLRYTGQNFCVVEPSRLNESRPRDTNPLKENGILDQEQIAVVGLGYVGLPVAVALGRANPVVGFDIDVSRIEELLSLIHI